MRPLLPQAESVLPFLKQVDARRIYTNSGPNVPALEQGLAHLLSIDPSRVVAMSSATAALQASLAVFSKKRWVAPAWSFAATGHAIHGAGASIAWSDVDPQTWMLGESDIRSAALHDCGVSLTLPFGADFGSAGPWSQPATEMVVDAAASIGADLSGLQDQSERCILVISLHATKVLGCGEGGFAVAPTADLATEIRRYRSFGFDEGRIAVAPGTNAKMSELGASYALAALGEASTEFEQWRLQEASIRALAEALGLPYRPANSTGISPYWLMDFSDAPDRRHHLEAVLDHHRVEYRYWWPLPLPEMPAFSSTASHSYPVSRRLASGVMGLPKWRDMGAREWTTIKVALSEFVSGVN